MSGSGGVTPAIQWAEIPTSSNVQSFNITLNGIGYTMYLHYHDTPMGGWILDIADKNNVLLVCGIPFVTGANLLEQYEYLGIGGSLICATDGSFLTPPTFENLGTLGHLYFGVRTA